MILEIDTSILQRIQNISLNQLFFLTLVSNGGHATNQDIQTLVSLLDEEEIQELITREYVSVIETPKGLKYDLTDKYKTAVASDKTYFDTFYEVFPVMVTRPDGTRGFLRANVNKCRREYNKIIGRSALMHEHLMKCLKYEMSEKMKYGKIGYMKTMWKWLVNREWEAYEDALLQDETKPKTQKYGTTIL